jgi:hypothetical protein
MLVVLHKVASSRPDEVNSFLIYLILPAALGPGIYSASNRNECLRQTNVSGRSPQRSYS